MNTILLAVILVAFAGGGATASYVSGYAAAAVVVMVAAVGVASLSYVYGGSYGEFARQAVYVVIAILILIAATLFMNSDLYVGLK